MQERPGQKKQCSSSGLYQMSSNVKRLQIEVPAMHKKWHRTKNSEFHADTCALRISLERDRLRKVPDSNFQPSCRKAQRGDGAFPLWDRLTLSSICPVVSCWHSTTVLQSTPTESPLMPWASLTTSRPLVSLGKNE